MDGDAILAWAKEYVHFNAGYLHRSGLVEDGIQELCLLKLQGRTGFFAEDLYRLMVRGKHTRKKGMHCEGWDSQVSPPNLVPIENFEHPEQLMAVCDKIEELTLVVQQLRRIQRGKEWWRAYVPLWFGAMYAKTQGVQLKEYLARTEVGITMSSFRTVGVNIRNELKGV